ncbi:MAG: hemerythrin domain-containing protein [Rhodocyclaceae bacterium]
MRKLSLRLKHLSQEHRAAMLLVAAAREVSPLPGQDPDLPGFGLRVCNVFQTEMEPHFQEEERHALPKLREIGRDDLADKVLAQHEELRAMIAAFGDKPDPALVERFSQLLQEHVDFEENVVWEALDEATAAVPHTVA